MSDLSKRMPLVELEKTPEYQRLTPKQQLFVATYCEGGLVDGKYDAVAATQTAYACKSLEVARIMSYSMMANIRIVAVLNRHFNTEPIEEFLTLLDRAIHNKKLTIAQLSALRLKCDILGFANRLPGSPGGTPHAEVDATQPSRKKKASEKPPRPEKPTEYGFQK